MMEKLVCGSNKLVLCLIGVALLLHGSRTAVALSCGEAVSTMAPCGGYLIGVGDANPTPRCCQSVQSLSRMAATVTARKAMCECFKQTAPSFGVKPERVKSLLAFCKLQINLPISPNVDCNHV